MGKQLRIVFMGTPEFAVATLGSLLMNGFNVVGVVTATDKPSGRGRKITKPAVKEFAEFSYLPIMQPADLKDPVFIDELKKLNPDLFIVAAFRMLPEVIWRIPPMGTINLHASLLPHYRGAAPINHAIINGEHTTGVTTFMIDNKIDTGNILMREEIPIFAFENAGDLHDRLMIHGARLVIRTIIGLADQSLIPKSQSQFLEPGEIPKPAPKIFPENCIIDWNNDPHKIHNFIRGLSPYPCARSFFIISGQKLLFKIYESYPESVTHDLAGGSIVTDGRQFMKIACKGGFVNILNLGAEGRRRMNIADFLMGAGITGSKTLTS